ncbi:MAG: hypothetical protein OEY66_06660 [Gammaproteobacteria bacterium]|nr:hypothetical protein [Gammaproteobacteria bacterium]
MKTKWIYTILLVLFFSLAQAENLLLNDVTEVLIKNNIIFRDSGENATKEFLSSCIQSQSPTRHILECDDVLFAHYISYFEYVDDKSTIILITEDGASVENRWVFQVRGGKYIDIKDKVWPNITGTVIGQLLIQETGNAKYTSSYVSSVAHSSYRVLHTMSNILKVQSGIPDESFGIELGVIEWDGNKFNFVPKKQLTNQSSRRTNQICVS